jgi:hypothetical protein
MAHDGAQGAHNTFADGWTATRSGSGRPPSRMGEQPRADPDADLIEFEVRRYRDGLCKRLLDGCWIAALEDDTAV